METRALSQRKSFIQEKDNSNKAFEILHKEFYSSKTNNWFSDISATAKSFQNYETSGKQKPKISDLFGYEEQKKSQSNLK